jgi:hypothetical protein
MNIRIVSLLPSLVLLVGCDSYGVAGASRDSKRRLADVNNYKPFMSSSISEQVIRAPNPIVTQHFEDIFRSFALSAPRIDGNPVTLPSHGLTATFKNHELIIQDKHKILVNDPLPSVFDMHPLRLGVDEIGGVKVIMVVNKSRASTGRYFVALYRLDGTALYKRILTTGQVWDISKGPDHIDIQNRQYSLRLAFKAPK